MQSSLSEFVKFCLVGLLSTIVNYGIFFSLLNFLGINYIICASLGYIAGVLVGFGLNRNLTFSSSGKKFHEFFKYFLAYVFSLFLGLSMLAFLVQGVKIDASAAYVLVIGLTTMTNFLGSKFFAFRKIELPKTFNSKLFFAILLLKIFFAMFFGSAYLVEGAIPFVNYFVSNPLENPYQNFFELGEYKAFPYSTTMLLSLAVPFFLVSFLPGSIINNGFLQLLLSKIPLLLADIGIFFILLRLLRTKETQVLLYYWCSPIIFYISYFHGQLDAIPTFFLLLCVYLLLTEKYLGSALSLGVALSAKANIFVALPFIFLYLWRNEKGAKQIIKFFAITLATYIVAVLPFFFSQGYQKLVLGAQEQWWIFLLQIPLGEQLIIYLVPLVLVVFFMRLSYFRKINQDAVMMAFAGAFTILVTLVPPRPGWFFWVVPFLVYFFVKDENISKKNYFALNALFLLYFLVFSRESDLFQSFQMINPQFSEQANIYELISSMGIDAGFVSNIVFTLFTGVLLVNFYFIYKFGLIANLRYKKSGLKIGLTGDSGSGKSYIGLILKDLVGEKNLTVLEGDDLHKWERSSENWKNLTHLNPKANLLQKEVGFVEALDSVKKLKRKFYDHDTGSFSGEKLIYPKKFTLVSGLHSFYLSKMRNILDLRIFLDPDVKLKKKWKIERDVMERGYSEKNVLSSIKRRRPDAKKYLEPQKKFADVIISYSMKKNSGTKIESKELGIIIENSYDIHSLSSQLEKNTQIVFDINYNDDFKTLAMHFSGNISKEEVSKIAYNLVPNLEEVLENRSIVLREGVDGVLQIVLLLSIAEKLTSKKEEES